MFRLEIYNTKLFNTYGTHLLYFERKNNTFFHKRLYAGHGWTRKERIQINSTNHV